MSASTTPASAPSGSSSATPAAGTLKGVVAAPTAISTVDGVNGRLIYRGYSIDDLAEHTSFEEVVYLLWEGNLPTRAQLEPFEKRLAAGRALPPQVLDHLRTIPHAHPLAVLRTGVSLLSHYDPQVEDMDPAANRAKAERLIGQIPTLVAARRRLLQGEEPVAPREDLSAACNFLWMLQGKEPDDLTSRAIDIAFTLHAEHEFNASTFALRIAASTYVDLHSALVAAYGTLKGPRHGGANEDVIEMVQEIGSPDRAETWTRERLARRAAATPEQRADPSLRFPGFGHAVYKVLDPRARQLQKLFMGVAEAHGAREVAEIQETVRRIIEEELGLFPNVDYYSAGLYYALGIPIELFTSIFAIARTAGYVAHYDEQLSGGRLIRPRGEYTGPMDRHVVPIDQRG